MSKKSNYPVIRTVHFCYIGENSDFNKFLESVIHDYVKNEAVTNEINCNFVGSDENKVVS